MPGDMTDLAPDSALVDRLKTLEEALEAVYDQVLVRKHLQGTVGSPLAESQMKLLEAIEAAQECAEPDDPVNAKYRSRMRGEGVHTLSGVMVYPYDPKPEEIRHVDIVAGLTQPRYSGLTPRHITIAEHSIKVAAVAEHLAKQMVDNGELASEYIDLSALAAILHDAHEAYLGDMLGPLEGRLCDIYGTPWSRLKQNLQDAIHQAYGIPPLPAEVDQVVRLADRYVFYCECLVLKPDYDVKPVAPPDVIPIGKPKLQEPPRETVKRLFDGEVRRLVSLLDLRLPLGEDDVETALATGKRDAPDLREVMKDVPVPGERPPDPPPKPKPEYLPNFERPPRPDDVSQSAWRNVVSSTDVQVPADLQNDPEFKREGGGE